MCFGPQAPLLYYNLPERERASRAELTSDQCIIDGQHYFILGRILIPVIDGPDSFVWLAWVSLSEKSFLRCSELWESKGRESEPPYFGWLQSDLPYPVPTLNLRTSVQTMPVGERPLITVEHSEHPLSLDQRNGITIARVQEIAEELLHG